MFPGTYYAIVVPKDRRAYSALPYTLNLDVQPLDIPSCTWEPTYTIPHFATDIYTGATVAPMNPPMTLILYNPTRLARTYGLSRTNALTQSLRLLADAPYVRGILYPIGESAEVAAAYNAWNAAYCSVPAANALAQAIRESVIAPVVNDPNNAIEYLVVVGSDEQIPLYRQKDLTAIANEREFARAQYAGSATGAATRLGYYLTDDAYGTLPGAELGWRGQYFWRPSRATGRLVETPEEMSVMINAFLEKGGLLNASDALVTGYDFITDSALSIESLLAQMLTTAPDSLISDTWTADDLRAAWPNHAASAPDLVSVNAHFEHWAALPASATTTADLFFNTDILNAQTPLNGTVGWTMGCHAGYNVPDAMVNPLVPQTSPDFPQAFARKAALWIANTGYGYGTDDGIAGSERLMVYFTQELGRTTASAVGQSLRIAKLRYLDGLPRGGLTPYEAKSIMETTLYGLPMFTIEVPQSLSPLIYTPPVAATSGATGTLGSAVRTVRYDLTPTLELHQGAAGDFYGLGDAAGFWTHGIVGRPLLPSAVLALDAPTRQGPMWEARDVILQSATLESHTGINPIVTRPITDITLPEPALHPGLGWLSPQLFAINRANGDSARLTALFALFNAQTPELRLLTDVHIDVTHTHPDNDDYLPPHILTARAQRSRLFPLITLEAAAEDAEGEVVKVYITFINETRIWSVPLSRDNSDPDGRRWQSVSGNVAAGTRYFVQAVDDAGNVAVAMGKGEFIPINNPMDTHIYLPVVLR